MAGAAHAFGGGTGYVARLPVARVVGLLEAIAMSASDGEP
jgi:hypothetical protein